MSKKKAPMTERQRWLLTRLMGHEPPKNWSKGKASNVIDQIKGKHKKPSGPGLRTRAKKHPIDRTLRITYADGSSVVSQNGKVPTTK